VAEQWPEERDKARVELREAFFERIRDALLLFTARGYFAQVMQQEHHHRCYRKWQETFQVERLYRDVRDEVREMHDYLHMRRTERLQQLAEGQRRRLDRIAWPLGIPLLLLEFLHVAELRDIKEWMPAWIRAAPNWSIVLGTLLFGLGVGYLLYSLSVKRASSHERQDINHAR
jgi:hypothetical protein